jgi:hypothetical protein
MTNSEAATPDDLPANDAKSKPELPKNVWGVAGLLIKALGNNAGAILICAAMVYATYMFIEQNQRQQKATKKMADAQAATVDAATASSQKKLNEANVALIASYEARLTQSKQQTADMAANMERRKAVNHALIKEQDLLMAARNDVAKSKEETRKANEGLQELKNEAAKITVELADANSQVSGVVSWGELFRLSNLAGAAAASTSPDKAAAHIDKMKAIELGDMNQELQPLIGSLETTLSTWEAPGESPASVKNAALDLALKCRELFKDAPVVLSSIVTELERELYFEAIAVSGRLANTTDWVKAEKDRIEFWSLYYGRLVFVESDAVATAMIDYNDALSEWKQIRELSESEREALRLIRVDLVLDLAKACGQPEAVSDEVPVPVDQVKPLGDSQKTSE